MNRRLLIALILSLVAGCGDSPDPGNLKESIHVQAVASIFPLADVVREVGGERVHVECLLPPGRTPHGYEPTPMQAEILARSRLLFLVGAGLDPWVERSAEASGNSTLRIVRMAEDHGHEHEHDHDGSRCSASDPHLWMDPLQMRDFISHVVDALSEADPDGAKAYARRGKVYELTLTSLHERYEIELTMVKRKKFISFHNAFTHLAERYGLTQVALTDPGMNEAGPARLEKAVTLLRSQEIGTLFVEPQFSPRDMEVLAREAEVKVGCLDPLGSPAAAGRWSYIDLMEWNLDALIKGLGDE